MEDIAFDGGYCILYYLQGAGMLTAQGDTTSRAKTCRIDDAHLGLVPVTIADEFAAYTGLLN